MPSPTSVWTVMTALLATHLAGMGAFLTIPVLAPLIAAETGLPASLAGIHTALVYAGALASGPATGALVTRYGGIRVLQAGLVVIGCGIALAVLGHPAALVASAMLAGFGHGPVTPSGSHLLAARTSARQRALVFSLKQTGVPGGAMLVAALAPVLGTAFGWRWGVAAMALVAFLTAAALQPLRRHLDAERDRSRPGLRRLPALLRDAGGSIGLLRHHGRLRALTLMAAGYGVSQFCFGTFFVVFQVEALGAGVGEAGLRLAIAQAAGVAGRILWAVAADRIGARPVLVLCGLGAAAAGLALALAGPGWPGAVVTLAGVAMGATAVGWNGVMLAETARVAPPGQVGAATAALSFCFALAMIVAPPLFSALVGLTGGYAAGFCLCAATALGGALALRGLREARGGAAAGG